MRCYFLTAVIFFLPLSGMADGVTIRALPSSVCNANSDDYNSHVYSDGRCVLYFPSESSDGDDIGHETEAIININGTIVRLLKEKDKDGHFFSSVDGSVNISMNVSEVSTSCVEGEDKCCGSDYAGTLSVKTPKGSASVRVGYYRGG